MPPTNSSWLREALAVFGKEWRIELRSRHSLFTAGLFGLLSVVAMSLASFGQKPSPNLAAGLLTVTLLFAAVVTLPRVFLVEDEQGTFDLLRLIAEPTAAFSGKALYAVAQTVIVSAVLGVLSVTLLGVNVVDPLLFGLGLGLTAVGLGAGVSVCGALAMGTANRWVLASALAMPVLFPQVFLSIGVLRVALGQGSAAGGWQSALGLAGWDLTLLAAGPLLAASAWATIAPRRPTGLADPSAQSTKD